MLTELSAEDLFQYKTTMALKPHTFLPATH